MIDEMAELVLEPLRFAVTRRVSREMLQGLGVDAVSDWVGDQLVVSMRKELLTHRLLTDEAQVHATGTVRTTELPTSVLVEIPNGWWRRLLRRPTRTLWADVVGNAAYVNPPDGIPVLGTATVRADYFALFPEPQFEYPAKLGEVRFYARTRPPEGWTPLPGWAP